MEREGAAVTCDGRLLHRRAAATGNALSPTVDRRVCRTSRDVDEAERSRRLASVSAGRRIVINDGLRNGASHCATFLLLLYVYTVAND